MQYIYTTLVSRRIKSNDLYDQTFQTYYSFLLQGAYDAEIRWDERSDTIFRVKLPPESSTVITSYTCQYYLYSVIISNRDTLMSRICAYVLNGRGVEVYLSTLRMSIKHRKAIYVYHRHYSKCLHV